MASKKEIFAAVSAAVAGLCEEHKVSTKFKDSLNALLSLHLEPKSGGAVVNLDEVTQKDASGKITHIKCSVSGKFLPATAEFFYEDKSGKGIGDTGLKRLSKQAESIRKRHIKVVSTTEKAIMADVFDGKLTPEQGKIKLEKIKASLPDYSKVSETVPVEEAAE